jgi:hypothetical protein
MVKYKRVFQIFNVLWNAAIQEEKSPDAFWAFLPDWAKEYLKEELRYSEVGKEGDRHFNSMQPNMKYRSFGCLADGDDSYVIVAWDDEATPPLRHLLLTPDFDKHIGFFMPTRAMREGAEDTPSLPKREVAN